MTAVSRIPAEDMAHGRQIAFMRERIEDLEEENARLRSVLQPESIIIPTCWRLSPSQARMMRLLISRPIGTYQALSLVAIHHDGEPEWAKTVVRQHIGRIRKSLASRGIRIIPVHGEGYALDDRAGWRRRAQAEAAFGPVEPIGGEQ